MKQTAVYLRVSTLDQESGIKSQETALRDYVQDNTFKSVRWYRDRLSGSTVERPAFERLQKSIQAGRVSTVIVWKLDRLSRSLSDGIEILTDWCNRRIRVISITQNLDFNGTIGKILAALLLGLAEMERENIRENTKRGLRAAKARGVKLGRPTVVKAAEIKKLEKKGMTVTQIAQELGTSRQTIYNTMNR